MPKNLDIQLVWICAGIVVLLFTLAITVQKSMTPISAIPAADVSGLFVYLFDTDGTVEETGSMQETASPYWWLNSGGKMLIAHGIGETIQGPILSSDPWYTQYASDNPADTLGGAYPQNLFRLLTRSTWENVREESDFYIAKDNIIESPNRNDSNGLLLMSRYSDDGQTLYYAGIRVDGTAVIKKKYKGTYYTMEQKPIFPGNYSIQKKKDASQNLLPHQDWIRLRTDTVTDKGIVTVTLSIQDPASDSADVGQWSQLLSAKDDGKTYDSTPIIGGKHFVGIRTDFMDVKFRSFLAEQI